MADAAALAPQPDKLAPKPPALGDDPTGLRAAEAETEQLIKKNRATVDNIPVPKLETVPSPNTQPTEPKEIWGSSAMAFAALGSLMTRQPIITALNAGAKVMTAYRQGDQERADQAFKTYKVATENAEKAFEFQKDLYNAAVEKADTDDKIAIAELIAKTHVTGDETMRQRVEQDGILGAKRLELERQNFFLRMQEAAPKMEEQADRMKVYHSLQSAQKALASAKTPEEKKTANDNLQSALADAKNLNLSMGKGGSASSGTFRSLPAMVANKFMQEHPDATAEDAEEFAMGYISKTKGAAAFATGTQGNSVRSFNVLLGHLNTMDQLIDAMHNGNIQATNSLAQRLAQETGQPAPTNFDAVRQLIANEIVKASTGAAGALGDRDEILGNFQRAGSPEQLHGITTNYRHLATDQLRGLKKQYESSTGEKDFERLLSPEARATLNAKSSKSGSDYSHLWQ